MSNYPIIRQPKLTDSVFTLMPDEYIRFEYTYKPGCCCFSSKRTIITNRRLVTCAVKTPAIFSNKTSTVKGKYKMIYFADISDLKQLQMAISSMQYTWWMKCIDTLTCTCSNQEMDWLESCCDIKNLSMDTGENS